MTKIKEIREHVTCYIDNIISVIQYTFCDTNI